MLLYQLPVEIQIKIYSHLDINSIYNLLLTRKDINLIVKTHFIKKEKWAILNEFQDINDIIKLINSGYRYISLNKRIQLICNYSLINKQITQIMTNKGMIVMEKNENGRLGLQCHQKKSVLVTIKLQRHRSIYYHLLSLIKIA